MQTSLNSIIKIKLYSGKFILFNINDKLQLDLQRVVLIRCINNFDMTALIAFLMRGPSFTLQLIDTYLKLAKYRGATDIAKILKAQTELFRIVELKFSKILLFRSNLPVTHYEPTELMHYEPLELDYTQNDITLVEKLLESNYPNFEDLQNLFEPLAIEEYHIRVLVSSINFSVERVNNVIADMLGTTHHINHDLDFNDPINFIGLQKHFRQALQLSDLDRLRITLKLGAIFIIENLPKTSLKCLELLEWQNTLNINLIHSQNIELAKIALENGAQIDGIYYEYDRQPVTALFKTVFDNNTSLARYLLTNKANPNTRDYYGRTALHQAVKLIKDNKLIDSLIASGAKADVKSWGFTSTTILGEAIESSNLRVINFALAEGVDVDAICVNKQTALSLALYYGDSAERDMDEIIDVLLNAKVDVNYSLEFNNDQGSLKKIVWNNNTNLLKKLIKAGANIYDYLFDYCNTDEMREIIQAALDKDSVMDLPINSRGR